MTGMKIKLYFCMILFSVFMILYTESKALAATEQNRKPVPEPQLFSQAAVLMDGDTGRILWGKNEDRILPMASTTKIMTCILALENSELDDEVKVSDYAASMPDVQLKIRPGETYRMEDLLYSMMLESHNDSAVAIAEHVGGSVEKFADMMNQKARDIGCFNTNFVTPNGLDAKEHATTAEELALLMRYCISYSPQKDRFLEITRALSYTFSDLECTRSFSCINHNVLLSSMEGAISGKTGFTNKAGYCYVGAVKKGEKTFIAALLACGWPPYKLYKWQDMKKLITYGDTAYDYYEIVREEMSLTVIPVERGIENNIGVEISDPDKDPLKILMRKDETVTIKTKAAGSLTAPIEEGMVVGQVDYYLGQDLINSYPIRTTGQVKLWNIDFCAKKLLNHFLFCYNAS